MKTNMHILAGKFIDFEVQGTFFKVFFQAQLSNKNWILRRAAAAAVVVVESLLRVSESVRFSSAFQ